MNSALVQDCHYNCELHLRKQLYPGQNLRVSVLTILQICILGSQSEYYVFK